MIAASLDLSSFLTGSRLVAGLPSDGRIAWVIAASVAVSGFRLLGLKSGLQERELLVCVEQ